MGHKIKCVDSRVNVNIVASTSVPFTLTTVQVPNFALTPTRRITLYTFTLHFFWAFTVHTRLKTSKNTFLWAPAVSRALPWSWWPGLLWVPGWSAGSLCSPLPPYQRGGFNLLTVCKFTPDLTMGESAKSLPRHWCKSFWLHCTLIIKRLCHMTETLGEFWQKIYVFQSNLRTTSGLQQPLITGVGSQEYVILKKNVLFYKPKNFWRSPPPPSSLAISIIGPSSWVVNSALHTQFLFLNLLTKICCFLNSLKLTPSGAKKG